MLTIRLTRLQPGMQWYHIARIRQDAIMSTCSLSHWSSSITKMGYHCRKCSNPSFSRVFPVHSNIVTDVRDGIRDIRDIRGIRDIGGIRDINGIRDIRGNRGINGNRGKSTWSSPAGMYRKMKHVLKTIFRSRSRETTREVQERRDMYWMALSMVHRDLRLQHQWQKVQHDYQNDDYQNDDKQPRLWRQESNQELEALLNEATMHLDDHSQLDDMTIRQLRAHIQLNYIEPQLKHLLQTACQVEDEMLRNQATNSSLNSSPTDSVVNSSSAGNSVPDNSSSSADNIVGDTRTNKNTNQIDNHDVDDDDDDEYTFNQHEVNEYRSILLREYDATRRALHDYSHRYGDNCGAISDDIGATGHVRRTPSSVPFWTLKLGAIVTLLDYYNWWPNDCHIEDNGSNKLSTSSLTSSPTSLSTSPLTSSSTTDSTDEFGFNSQNADPDLISAMRYYHVRNLIRSIMVRHPPSSHLQNDPQPPHQPPLNSQPPPPPPTKTFALLPLRSTLPHAGRGVYIDGYAPAGTLLALFPGKVWPKEHLSAMLSSPASINTWNDDPRHQLSLRYDDILIDSRKSPYTVIKNLFALGHIVNHPAPPRNYHDNKNNNDNNDKKIGNKKHHPHEGPNCGTILINYTERMIKNLSHELHHDDDMTHLSNYIPNEYERPPQPWGQGAFDAETIYMHGMGLVALRDVQDEELFYDYRLSSNNNNDDDDDEKKEGGSNKYPGWYHVWDEEAIQNVWSKEDEG